MEPVWFDALIGCILLYAAIRGAMKGLVWQLAWIAAILLSFAFSETVSTTVAVWIPIDPPLNRWVAMFALYLLAAFLSFAAASKLNGWIEKAKLKEFDRHLGAIFGFLKGTVFSLVLMFFAVTLSASLRETALQSYSGRAAAVVMDNLHPVMPHELHDILHPYTHSLDDAAGTLKNTNDHDHDRKPPKGGKDQDKSPADSGTDQSQKNEQSPTLNLKNSPLTDSKELKSRLLDGIAEIYVEFPQARKSFIDEVERRLADLSPELTLQVLRDWDADIRLREPDPEPATNSLTSLTNRIRTHRDSNRLTEKTADRNRRDSGRR